MDILTLVNNSAITNGNYLDFAELDDAASGEVHLEA